MENENQNHSQYEWESLFKDKAKILDIRYDEVFKAVFTKDTEKSRGALSSLVSAFIGKSIEVYAINANEPPVDDTRQRYLRFDISCKTANGELVNVEMSFDKNFNEPERLEYHTARLLTGQDIHGKDKKYSDLKECYQITILAKKIFFHDKNLTHNFLYYDPDTCVSLGGKTRIITVELEKTKPIAVKPVENMTSAELWAVFFQYLTNEAKRDKITEIIKQEEGIAMAVNTMGTFTRSELEYLRESSRIKYKLDYQTDMAKIKEEGREEARREKLLIAKNLLIEGSTVEFVHRITGLSLETITSLVENH